ncbi:MAG: 4Fe-4S dicluster domain-containing protein, partial [Chloroflexi bacterium]|nr:4Fe-4S dicluster domain-containing protein [Chloroflexota bacterium]
NIPINSESAFDQQRAIEWIRIERYWEGEFPNVKARFLPVLCQQCGNAPCEPVCPVFATYHNNEGLNVQVYNRCIGTRFCQNNCPYHVRFFNWFQPVWPEALHNHLNPDVTVRDRGIMEKCTFCIQRIRRGELDASRERRDVRDGDIQPACVQACPTDTLVFGDGNDPDSRVSKLKQDERRFKLMEHLGTDVNVTYLKKVDLEAKEKAHA